MAETTVRKSLYNFDNVKLRNKIWSGHARFSLLDNTGYDVRGCTSLTDVLDSTGLNYSGEKQPIYLANGTEIKGNFAMVKSDEPGRVLGIVGTQYTPTSNLDAFAIAQDIFDRGDAQFEIAGHGFGSHNTVDFSRSFLGMRGEDFEIAGDQFNSFIIFRNSFDGSGSVSVKFVCERVVCLNGMVRYLGGKNSQIAINIQHSSSVNERLKKAQEIIMKRQSDIRLLQQEAELFMAQGMTKAQFEKEIIPLVLKQKGMVETEKDRQRGHERVAQVVAELMACYNADDTQNYNGSAYKVLLALSDYETHSAPLRDSGNNQVYMNRILKGMVLTTGVAEYIAKTRGLSLK